MNAAVSDIATHACVAPAGGHLVNHKRLFRLYREEKYTVRKRGGRKRSIGTLAQMLVPMAANDRSLPIHRFPVLASRKLDRLIEERGKPRMIVRDNGSEFTINAILQWTDRVNVDWHCIAPGNADPERLLRKLQWSAAE